jgi:succinyl-CoA synthetase beta subunit
VQLLEHESKTLLADRGVEMPAGGLAASADEAQAIADRLPGRVAVKAQVPASGRGKAGGVKLVDWPDAGAAARALLGARIKGFRVDNVLVEEAPSAQRELYLGIVVDARQRRPVLLLGEAGGVDVEQHAGAVARVPFTLSAGVRASHVWRAADAIRLDAATTTAVVPIALALGRTFREERAQVAEINPLLDLGSGRLVVADVRIVPDPSIASPPAAGSAALGFDYVVLDSDGDVGLITTGAGASLMVIDLLRAAGLRPIDFCDIRTGGFRGNPARLHWVLDDFATRPGLQCIAINFFAGITDLEDVVGLLVASLRDKDVDAPVVARIEGRGAVQGRERLAAAGVTTVDSPEELVDAVERVVASAGLEA